MKCVIIAAGKGERISGRGPSKPLIRLLGVPLIERTIRTAAGAGLDDFCVVTGHNGHTLTRFLDGLGRRMGVRIKTLKNERWEEGNGISVLRAEEAVDGRFVLLMSDHVFDGEILKRLRDQPLNDGEVRLAVDYGLDSNDSVDVEDVTKVLVNDGRIDNIGKHLANYNAYDTGIFLCSPSLFSAVRESLERGDTSLSGAVRILAEAGLARPFNTEGRFWIDVDDPVSLAKGRSILLSNLSSKSADGWVSRRLNRPLSSRVFTPLLLKFFPGITANQVSALSFLVALVSAACFFLGHVVGGAVLLHLASVLDGCDGEVARLKHLQSKIGDYLDAVLDRYADGIMFAGFTYYVLQQMGDRVLLGLRWHPLLIFAVGVAAILGHIMVSYTSAKSVVNLGYRYSGRWIAAGRGRDVRLFIFFAGGLAAHFNPVFAFLCLAVTAVHTNLVVAWRVGRSWRLENSQGRSAAGELRAVIFDFDGTLADTMPFLTDLAVRLMTAHYHLAPEEARTRYLETTGLDFASQLEEIFPNHTKNAEVVAAFETEKNERILEQPLFPDTIPTLAYLAKQDVKTFVCSSTRQELIDRYARKAGLANYVDDLRGFRNGRNKAEQLRSILAETGIRPDQAIFVGDSPRDGDLAESIGLGFVRVVRGEGRDSDGGIVSLDALREIIPPAGSTEYATWSRHPHVRAGVASERGGRRTQSNAL
ncbi:MAG: HAD hydrolase-like protein [bacterium]|nr:HAD hydrolase-like protein [bacterium]